MHGHHHVKGFLFLASSDTFIDFGILNTESGAFHVAIVFVVVRMLSTLEFSSLVNANILSRHQVKFHASLAVLDTLILEVLENAIFNIFRF